MPAKRTRPTSTDPDLEPALAALVRALANSKVPWMVIGGVAVAMRGVKRMTTDIDAVVQGDTITPAVLAELLTRHHFALRHDDAVAFAQANLVLLIRHQPSGVELDISFGWTDFEIEALAARATGRYGKTSVPTARAEDLIIYKALAGRPKDQDDITTLLALHPTIDISRIRRRVSELTAVAETPELLDDLERLLRTDVHASKPSRPSSPRRPPPTRRRSTATPPKPSPKRQPKSRR